MSSNPILALNELPYATVHALACSANAIAARHVHPLRRWFWARRRPSGLMTCDLCHRAWVAPTETPKHADYCPVGRTQEVAQKIIAMGSEPLPEHLQPRIVETRTFEPHEIAPFHPSSLPLLRLEDHPLPGEEKCGEEFGIHGHELLCTLKKGHPAIRNAFGHWSPFLGTQTSPSHERSEGSAAAGRAGGNSSGANLPEAPDYQEPWAWDPNLGVVVDRNGNTVANMLLTDLDPLEQKEFGRRIAVCLNFCREMPNEELRHIDSVVAGMVAEEREEAVTAPREVIQ